MGKRLTDLPEVEVMKLQNFMFWTASPIVGIEDAEDIVQNAFVQGLEEGELEYLFAWARLVTYSGAMQVLRGRDRRKRRDENLRAQQSSTAPIPYSEIERGELSASLDVAFANLPYREQRVAVAHLIYGLNHKQIAQKLHITEKTVSKRIKKAISRLRRMLNVHY